MGPAARRRSIPVAIGRIMVGGNAPIVVQSMTNTDTADVASHRRPGRGAGRAPARSWCGSPSIATRRRGRCRTSASGSTQARRRRAADRRLPLHRPQAADREPGLRRGARQVPDQPRQRRLSRKARPPVLDDDRGGARSTTEPVRIGVNWGSLDQELLVRLMDENAQSAEPKTAAAVTQEAMVVSAIESARRAERSRPRRRPDHPVVQGQRSADA